MPRLAMSPADAFARQDKALRLLRRGVGVRAVARAVGCSPSSVVRWRDAHAAQGDGKASERGYRRWDAHGTGGTRWDVNAKLRARGEAFRRRARAVPLGETPTIQPMVLDHYDHPDFVAARARFAAEPAFWDDNSEIVRRARIRISIDAFTVTRGRATAWTTGALPLLFDVRHLDAVPAELYRTADDREQAALALLEKTARRVGLVQDSAGIWHLPAGADEG